MSLVVNTNVSSLTAQRALAFADSLQGEAMTRLSTGSKINSASDDAAGLAIASRMTAQVNGLNMAVKNANDGISLTQSVEGALVEVADMLQRMRELAVQASNDTNTDTDRAFIQEEINLLIAEVSRVSSNTRYNGETVLDGSFSSKQIQVGTEAGEAISLTIDSVSAASLGAHQITGDRVEAQLGTGGGAYDNITDAGDDIIINGNSLSKTIDVAAKDTAKDVASKINTVSGSTGVTAEAKTYALLSSEYATDQTYSVRINNKTTGSFVISNSSVLDAVDKINSISGSTGVTATATTDNKVKLYSSDGSDILVENESTNTALKVQAVGHDGTSVQPSKYWHHALAADATNNYGLGVANGTYTIKQSSTGQEYSFTLAAATTREATLTELESAINGGTGLSGFKVVDNPNQANASSAYVTAAEGFGDFEIYSGTDTSVAANKQTFEGYGSVVQWSTAHADAPAHTGGETTSFVLRNASTGTDYSFSVTVSGTTEATAAQVQTGLNAITGLSGFVVDRTNAAVTTLDIWGPADFGNFTILKADSTALGGGITYQAGDLNAFDVELAAASGNDSATVQGTLALSSSKTFSVTQSDETSGVVTDPAVATGSLVNDNYFVTQASSLNTVSNVDLRNQSGASAALSVLDGAIEKISSMRASLGAVENRLDHAVANLMNISENTEAARSRIQDADFAAESAKLSKAQVLKQAGVGMLAQANAGTQLVLQLLQ
jgi:flagellin